jgi:hypothetical protein
MRITWAAGVACALSLLTACKKHDYCPNPQPQSTCNLMQSTAAFGSGDHTPQYRKEYDATGRVTKVVAALYSLVLEDSMTLLLHYQGHTVYFLSAENSTDTVLIASFDAAKRLTSISPPSLFDETRLEWFEPETHFSYTNKTLSRITRHTLSNLILDYFISYDEAGNVIRIYRADDDANAGTFFTYDLSVKATAQFYSDHFGTDFLNNQVYLAQFLGWLPDLMPVNRRTAFRQVFTDEDTTDDEPGYVFNSTELIDHVYDSKGNLVSYKIANGEISFSNTWHCTDKKEQN